MQLQQEPFPDGHLSVRNVGGITESSVDFSPGATILVGRNATNRTSFLQAVMAALGGENVSIKGDAEEASVELSLGDETYTRRLVRQSGTIVADGEPYLEDATSAELFAFLLESNEARQAVVTDQELRELIMRPIDTEAIESEIDDLIEQRDALEADLEEIDELKGKLPELEKERTRLQREIDEVQSEIEKKERELQEADESVKETRREQSQFESKLEELRDKRATLEDVRYDIETEQESLESLESERQQLERKRADLPETSDQRLSQLESEISQYREQKQRLNEEVSNLQSVIGFNEEMISEAESAALEPLSNEDQGDVMDELVPDDGVTCWTCGTPVERTQIEQTIDQLREMSQSKVADVKELESKIESLRSEKQQLQQTAETRRRLTEKLSEIDSQIERTGGRVEQLKDRRDSLRDEVKVIEEEVEELDDEDGSEILELHKEVNELEYQLGRLEADLERVGGNIAEIEARIAEEKTIKSDIEQVSTEIKDLRTKIGRIEGEAVEQFNEHMDTVLDLLDYENLERVWIEQVERDVTRGHRTVSETAFELHVVRSTQSNTAYEDTVDHLSESEREVTGLVFALAGYLAHEVHEEVPFMLLDSLEAIDADRIATLIEHLTEYTAYLLVALLPEDAASAPDEYERVTEI